MIQRHTNVYNGGMSADIDPHFQERGTYKHAKNLRLLHNTDPSGAITEGRSLSLEIMAGTSKAWAVPAGYTPIGEIDTPLGLLIFSHNGDNSEIGYVDPESEGVAILPTGAYRPDGYKLAYYTLYSDRYDGNGERLDLDKATHFQSTTTTENASVTRVQWVDGLHELRGLNVKLAFDESGVSYHQQIANGSRAAYPRHLSAHQMAVLPAVQFGDLVYQQAIPGSLLSGGYQVTYRYRSKDGHASPFAPLSPRPYFVSDKPIPGNYLVSHHARFMGNSGVATQDGMQFLLRGVDLRWDTLEVAVLYHRAGVGVERALLTHRINLPTLFAGDNLLPIDITEFTGTALSTQEFLSQQQGFDSVQSIASLNNRLYVFGLNLSKNLAVDASKATHGFCEQTYLSDETYTPTFKEKENPENPARKDGDKLTNSRPAYTARATNLFTDKLGNPVLKYLPIVTDYDNNKGVQVSAQLTGYRRGETYPFAALCIDTRGIPYFAVPIADVTFPDWASSPPAKKVGLSYQTVQLGVSFSGIRLPKDMVFDTSGKRRLGSVLILRGQPSGRIGFQALALNCCVTVPENKTTVEADKGYTKIEPHPSWNNGFLLGNSGVGGGPSHYGAHDSKSTNTNVNNQGAIIEISFKGRTDDPRYTINKAYWVELHAPDVLTTITQQPLPDLNKEPSARLQMIGAAHGSYGNEIRMDVAEGVDFPGSHGGPLHVYTKNYKTNGQLLEGGEKNGRPKLGSKTRIKTWFTLGKEGREPTYAGIDPENDKLVFDAQQSIMTQVNDFGFAGTAQPEYRIHFGNGGNYKPGQIRHAWNFVDAVLAPGTIIAKLSDWEAVDVIESPASYVSVAVVNYVKGADPQPPADERTYTPTGYQLNITDELLAQMPVDTDASGNTTAYVLNDCEVYGGDTFTNPVDIARLYPLWNESCERRNSWTPDYGVGNIVPMESVYNYALRQGRSLANNGFYSQEAACENRFLHATGGIAVGQPEEWNVNSVLLPKETIALYKPLPVSVKITNDRPYSVYVSQPKVYGERDDSYRQFRPLDYSDLDGTKGAIIRAEVLLSGIYIWQERDYGRLRARDRAILPSSIGELTTGTGKDLDGVDYAGQGVGLHEFTALTSGGGRAYWIDSERKLFCRMSQAGKDELSERQHQHDYFFTTLPDRDIADVALGLDEVHGDVWVSYGRLLTNQVRTILYNEKGDFFTTEADWKTVQPRRYVSYRGKLYGLSRMERSRTDKLDGGVRGVYFDEPHRAELDWVVNPDPMHPKTFDNIALNLTAPQALVSLQMSTLTDTQYVNLTQGADSRVKYRNGRLCFPLLNLIPRNGHAEPRLRADYLRLLLTIDAQRLTGSQRFTLTASETLYRLAPRV